MPKKSSRKKELPPTYNPKETEDKIYRLWEKSGFFNPDNLPTSYKLQAKAYCITMAPPNITGSLHMGHALEYTISDVLIRQKRMAGFLTLWLPGTDHAGIATQNVVEKTLRKENITRHDLSREKFIKKIWEWKELYGNIIINQLKKLGVSADWSRERFTMDKEYAEAVKTAFLHYYQKGWIYRDVRVINWCCRCATSLSDLEVEHKEVDSKLYHIKYPVEGGGEDLIVATSRPETMLGDTAVAVNPKDKRYFHFIGRKVMLPIQNRLITIIGDEAVDMEFGTGAVKVTPAHDFLDAEIGQRHRLESIQVVDQNGRMAEKAGPFCAGLKTEECRQKVVEELKNQGLLAKEELYKQNLAVCSRCDTTIEPLPSLQWFLKMDKLAKTALKAGRGKKVNFQPKRWEKIYFDRLENEKDWCVSRQLWWGHRLPVYFCISKNKQEEIKNQKSKIKINEAEFIVSEKKPKKCPFCKNCEMEQSTDVLDTWFSSALWPFAALGWPRRTKDLKKFYPTNLITNDRGIINLWDARMVFSGLEFMGKIPFRDILIHATILTKEGQRMSKSLGTGIDPMELIGRYGTDATRFGLVWQAMGGQDIRWSEEHVNAGKKFANKIWNASRFVLMNLKPITYNLKPKTLTKEDRKIINDLQKIKKGVSEKIDRYEFGPALHDIYDFFWHSFCDKYLESAKIQLADPQKTDHTKRILLYTLAESLKIIHPFMPFITEEIWNYLPARNKKLLLVEKWPK